MDDNQIKHKLNVADCITLLRIAGTVLLLALKPLSTEFFIVYALTGVTDILDGWIARKLKIADDFGAKLDSISDLLFYTVILVRLLPILIAKMPIRIWYIVTVIIFIRVSAYITAAVKYRRFASLHTYMNKFTGGAVFLVPFFLITDYFAVPNTVQKPNQFFINKYEQINKLLILLQKEFNMANKLYRSNRNKMICGVCGGVGEFFGIDPTLVRLGWVVFCALGGSGILAYIIAAIIVPQNPEY